MLTVPPSVRIYLAIGATDLRRSIDGLCALVREGLELEPMSCHLFLFRNRRGDRIKILVWDRSGYWVHYKRLEHGRFRVFDRVCEKEGAFQLHAHELLLVLEGIDLRGSRRRLSHDDLRGQVVER